ncbi:VWA domain-containing protein [Candidatus Dojkabacteria bacterium]|jgi:uncharacterized protein YegL|nr:VWA domain-containing protein [Candidatus Dojkabacteria bacterium]
MLKIETIRIKIRKNLIDYYNNLGYSIVDNFVNVNTKDLHNGSGAIVNVTCDGCDKELIMKYKVYHQSVKKYSDDNYYCKGCKYLRIKNTNMNKYGVENVMQIEEVKSKSIKTQLDLYGSLFGENEKDTNIINKYGSLENYYNLISEKKKLTCLEKYDVDNVMKVQEIKEKSQNTCLERHGEKNPMFIEKFVKESRKNQLKTKLKKGLIVPEDKLNDLEKYRKVIRRLVYKHKPILFDDWDGTDYYDNEYIKDNLSLHHLDNKYPTIDHQISVFFGFTKNIPPEIVGDISNLCITKRCINSSKCKKTPYEFLKNNENNENMKTKIICLLDKSGSMIDLQNDTIGGFNSFLEEQQQIDDICFMDIILFDSQFKTLVDNVNIKNVKKLDRTTYKPNNGTSLLDCIGMTITKEIDKLGEDPNNKYDKTLVLIMTDGESNTDKEYTTDKIKNMIEEMEKDFKWNFIFIGANQDSFSSANNIGISSGKAMNWTADYRGVEMSYSTMSKASTYYRTTSLDNYDNIIKDSE